MTRPASSSSLAAAALLGIATGMRSLLPLALLSLTQGSHRGLRARLLPLAATELVGDPRPWIPSRLGPVPLGARLLAGGIGAAWLTRSRRPTLLVLAGGAGALAGALLGSRARRRLPCRSVRI